MELWRGVRVRSFFPHIEGAISLNSDDALSQVFCTERYSSVLVVIPQKELAEITEDIARVFMAEWPLIKQQALGEPVIHVVFDLAEMESLSALLIKRILKFHRQLQRQDRHLVLCNISAATDKLLHFAGVTDICSVFETRNEALEWFRRE